MRSCPAARCSMHIVRLLEDCHEQDAAVWPAKKASPQASCSAGNWIQVVPALMLSVLASGFLYLMDELDHANVTKHIRRHGAMDKAPETSTQQASLTCSSSGSSCLPILPLMVLDSIIFTIAASVAGRSFIELMLSPVFCRSPDMTQRGGLFWIKIICLSESWT